MPLDGGDDGAGLGAERKLDAGAEELPENDGDCGREMEGAGLGLGL
jgi:hypothetical protein